MQKSVLSTSDPACPEEGSNTVGEMCLTSRERPIDTGEVGVHGTAENNTDRLQILKIIFQALSP